MNNPFMQYLVSSPYGDIPLDNDKLDFPLEGDISGTSYREYFHSIENFLAQEDFRPFLRAAGEKLGREITIKEVNSIIIRTEKHGLLYHPASIELILQQEKLKFCLNVAASDSGKTWLQEEISVLKRLHKKFHLPFLPRVYFGGHYNSMSFLLEDWFEGYHEFHITRDKEGEKRLQLWEFGKGYTYIPPEQSFELYKQASHILTRYYNFQDFREIYPWHHAAGDFVVKLIDKEIDVRLSTARRYEALLDYTQEINPLLALFYFFLNLSIRMRLDRIDGVGEIVWADTACLEATVAGFFEALKLKENIDDYPGLSEEFSGLARSFGKDELRDILKPILEIYQGSDDLPVIANNLEEHREELYATLQNFPL